MHSNEPSRLATLILQRFGSSPNNDSIIGDLNEQYRRGRSRLWYWRQVFVAIVVGTVSDVRRNKFMAVRALLTGWSLVFIGAKLVAPLIQMLRGQPLGTGLLPGSWVAVRWVYFRGWIVPAADAYVLVFTSCLTAFGIGWFVGRLHRPHSAKMVALFVASWGALLVPSFLVMAERIMTDWNATNWRHDNPYFLVFALGGNLLAMLSMLAGGLWSAPRSASVRTSLS